MGSKHRRKRVTPQRRRDRGGNVFEGRPAGARPGTGEHAAGGDRFAGLDDRAIARNVVAEAGGQLQRTPAIAGPAARSVAAYFQRIDGDVLVATIEEWLGYIVGSVVGCGWTPTDLGEIVARRCSGGQLPLLAALLTAETARHSDDLVAPQWIAELEHLPTPEEPELRSLASLERAFVLAAVLIGLPTIEQTIPPPGSRQHSPSRVDDTSSSKHLTRVRALLAKAESTDSVEEAEALSAKAQELISSHALGRLLEEPVAGHSEVVARRLWIDTPYVRAKSSLVHQVAETNRCRAVFTERLEFMTVIGEHRDLDAVELMTASLLVQAQTAMLAHGSQFDRGGTSRTRSFRQSFLVAYAARIGERLHAASEEAVAETGKEKALVPVLRRHAEHVDAARDEMFPQLRKGRGTSITNGEGWAAGTAAADLASLSAHKNVTAQR